MACLSGQRGTDPPATGYGVHLQPRAAGQARLHQDRNGGHFTTRPALSISGAFVAAVVGVASGYGLRSPLSALRRNRPRRVSSCLSRRSHLVIVEHDMVRCPLRRHTTYPRSSQRKPSESCRTAKLDIACLTFQVPQAAAPARAAVLEWKPSRTCDRVVRRPAAD